jgi:hypothetical protein
VSFGVSAKGLPLLVDPYAMTSPVHIFRKRPKARPRIVAVSDYWRTAGPEQGRQVLVQLPDGDRVTTYLPDTHPALVRFLDAAAVAA